MTRRTPTPRTGLSAVLAAVLAAALGAAAGTSVGAGGAALAQQPGSGADVRPADPRLETRRPSQAPQRQAAPGDVPVRERLVEPRTGPAQREAELVKTTLLNRFGQLGFSRLLSFEEQGDAYVAQVLTRTGGRATVVIDAESGEIYERR